MLLQRNWQELIKPAKVRIDRSTDSGRSATMVFEPLERGFGVTLGNALRRVLLSSIQGGAVTEVQFEGVLHEFSSLPGVYEDITEVVLNLKSLDVRVTATTPKRVRLVATGPCVVTAGMIEPVAGVEFLSPEQPICTLGEGAKVALEILVKSGKGYVSAAQLAGETVPLGTIVLDALFSPVRHVSFSVEHTRVGQITDHDRLQLHVQTNGAISPEDAVGVAARILQDQLQKFVNFSDPLDNELVGSSIVSDVRTRLPFSRDLLKKVDELDLSLRASNCLKRDNIVYIGDLVSKSENDLLRTPNFGRKSLQEISEVLKQMGLHLGMDVQGWPPENIEQLLKNVEEGF